jgi:hypothetical protein
VGSWVGLWATERSLVRVKCYPESQLSQHSTSQFSHLGLWIARARPPPNAHATLIREYAACDRQRHTHAETLYSDPETIPGMNTYSQNALRTKGVQERVVCLVLTKARLPGDSTTR